MFFQTPPERTDNKNEKKLLGTGSKFIAVRMPDVCTGFYSGFQPE